MVDPKLVDISSIDDETRYRIFDYLWYQKRISSTDLGISPTLANKIKNRKAKVTDTTLAKMLEFLTLEEFAKLTGKYVVEKVEPHTVVQVLKAALADPDLRWLVVDIVLREVGAEIREFRDTYRVTDEDLRKFEKTISKLSRKTREEYRAIYDALKDLNFELTPDKLREYVEELVEEHREKHPSIPRHVAKALKKFIKEVIIPKDPILGQRLYNSFRVPKERRKSKMEQALEGKRVTITLDDIKKVAKEFDNIDPEEIKTSRYHIVAAKTLFVLMAESGLRSGEIFKLTLDQVGIDGRIIKVMSLEGTKRGFITFFTEKTRELLREYLKLREEFLKKYSVAMANLGIDLEAVEKKLFPFKEQELRRVIRTAMERTLGRVFNLYELRSFFSSWLTYRGVPEWVINLMQGRTSEKDIKVIHTLSSDILRQHYRVPIMKPEDFIKWIRNTWYDPNIYCILCD